MTVVVIPNVCEESLTRHTAHDNVISNESERSHNLIEDSLGFMPHRMTSYRKGCSTLREILPPCGRQNDNYCHSERIWGISNRRIEILHFTAFRSEWHCTWLGILHSVYAAFRMKSLPFRSNERSLTESFEWWKADCRQSKRLYVSDLQAVCLR